MSVHVNVCISKIMCMPIKVGIPNTPIVEPCPIRTDAPQWVPFGPLEHEYAPN